MRNSALAFALFLATTLFAPALRAEQSASPADRESPAPSHRASRDRALFDIGVLFGTVEQSAAQGATPAVLIPQLEQIREHAATSGALQLPWRAIDALIDDLESTTATTGENSDIHQGIVQLRKTVSRQISRQATEPALLSEPAPQVIEVQSVEPFDCTPSTWEGVWDTSWGTMTLVFDDERFYGTYGSSQHGLRGSFDPDEPKVLKGFWDHFGSASTGGFRFEMKAPGRFAGGWSWEIPVEGMGSGWNGTRKEHDADILVVPVGEATIAAPQENGVRFWSQRWLIKNVSTEDFWIYGYGADSPFIQIYTQVPPSQEWETRGLGYCGTGASLHKIPKQTTFSTEISLPEELAPRKVAIEFHRYANSDDDGGTAIRTRSLRLVPPRAVIDETDPSQDKAANEGGEPRMESEHVAREGGTEG